MRCSVTSDSHHAVCVPRTDSFYNWDIVLSTPPLITSFIATPLHRSLRFFHTICSTSFEFASNVIHTEHIPNNTAALPTNINITQRGTRDPSWRCPDRTSGGEEKQMGSPVPRCCCASRRRRTGTCAGRVSPHQCCNSSC